MNDTAAVHPPHAWIIGLVSDEAQTQPHPSGESDWGDAAPGSRQASDPQPATAPDGEPE